MLFSLFLNLIFFVCLKAKKKTYTSNQSDTWICETLSVHNQYRELHGAPPLEWSEECYTEAKNAANHCSQIGRLDHTHLDGPSGRHGQNGYGGVGYGGGWKPKQAIDCWYDEVNHLSTCKCSL